MTQLDVIGLVIGACAVGGSIGAGIGVYVRHRRLRAFEFELRGDLHMDTDSFLAALHLPDRREPDPATTARTRARLEAMVREDNVIYLGRRRRG